MEPQVKFKSSRVVVQWGDTDYLREASVHQGDHVVRWYRWNPQHFGIQPEDYVHDRRRWAPLPDQTEVAEALEAWAKEHL